MKQYKLINQKTLKETICSLVTIDGFDYYVSNEIAKPKEYYYYNLTNKIGISASVQKNKDLKKIICTNNPNIDIPKVINIINLDELKTKWYDTQEEDRSEAFVFQYSGVVDNALEAGIGIGYSKAKGTYQFTEKDLISFAAFCSDNHILDNSDKLNIYWEPIFKDGQKQTSKELLSIWKEQQIKTIYYGD